MGLRLFFILYEGEVKMDNSGQPPEDTVSAARFEPWNL